MTNWNLDPISVSLSPHQGERVYVEWEGVKVLAYVLDWMHPEDMGTSFGGWILEVEEILKGPGSRTICGVVPVKGNPLEISLVDPPLTITDMNANLIWERSREA